MNNSKIALITGAAKGIGNAIARLFLENNYHVILVDKAMQDLANTKQELTKLYKNAQLADFRCDVGNNTQVSYLCSHLNELNLLPDILVNNAGYGGPFQKISEISDEEWDKVINTNLRSIFNFARILLPEMSKKNWGRVINIASIQGLIGANLSSTYVASKHGVIGYTKTIAAEWGKYGITCNAICPGYVDTSMGIQENEISDHYQRVISRTPIGKVASPKDIAYLVEFLATEKANFINGSIITIDGGILADIGIT
jgi:3-oxoacyl-[acyl-carrier protein] reductase